MLRALNFQLFPSILQRKNIFFFSCADCSCSVTPVAVSSGGRFCHTKKYFSVQGGGGGGGGGGLEDPHGAILSSCGYVTDRYID